MSGDPGYSDAAVVIVAASGFLTVVGGLVLQFLTFVRAGKAVQVVEKLNIGQKELHDSVNGQSEALKAALGDAAFAAGEKAGVAAERADPMTPAGQP